MTWGLRKAKRREASARPALAAASLRLRLSQTMASRAVLSLPVTALRRDRPGMAAFWRVIPMAGIWLSVMGHHARRPRIIGQIDDIAGLDLEIDAEGRRGGWGDVEKAKHEG